MILGRETVHWHERRTQNSLMKLAGRLSKGLLGDINKEPHLINKRKKTLGEQGIKINNPNGKDRRYIKKEGKK